MGDDYTVGVIKGDTRSLDYSSHDNRLIVLICQGPLIAFVIAQNALTLALMGYCAQLLTYTQLAQIRPSGIAPLPILGKRRRSATSAQMVLTLRRQEFGVWALRWDLRFTCSKVSENTAETTILGGV